MNEENKLYQELSKGTQAKDLLTNEIFTEAFEAVTESINSKILQSGPSESEYRELMYHAMQGAKLFYSLLKRHIETGNMAEKELERIRNHKQGYLNRKPAPFEAVV